MIQQRGKWVRLTASLVMDLPNSGEQENRNGSCHRVQYRKLQGRLWEEGPPASYQGLSVLQELCQTLYLRQSGVSRILQELMGGGYNFTTLGTATPADDPPPQHRGQQPACNWISAACK